MNKTSTSLPLVSVFGFNPQSKRVTLGRFVLLSIVILGLPACGNMFNWGKGANDDGYGRYGDSSSDSSRYDGQSVYANGTLAGDIYTVAKGDTLYSIAFRFGVDFKDMARWNNIAPPYVLQPGDQLLVVPPNQATIADNSGGTRSRVNRTADQAASGSSPAEPKAESESVNSRPSTPVRQPRAGGTDDAPAVSRIPARLNTRWLRPTQGRVVASFGKTTNTKNGVWIRGVFNQSIQAANHGQVVYVGNGIKGYGNLIIIKHDDEYLSAYGLNHQVLVKKDDWVRGGQPIATMGNNNLDRPTLHFEIRRAGVPVNPSQKINLY